MLVGIDERLHSLLAAVLMRLLRVDLLLSHHTITASQLRFHALSLRVHGTGRVTHAEEGRVTIDGVICIRPAGRL